MIRQGQTTLTTALDAITLNTYNQQCAAAFELKSNTAVTAVIIIEYITQAGSTTWYPIVGYNKNDFSALGGGNITLTDSVNYSIDVPNIQNAYQIRLKLVSIVSGTLTADAQAFAPTEVDNLIRPVPVTIATSAQTITSASATSLAVGPNGTTNPVFSVNGSVSSAATGLTIIGRAAAAGVDLNVISSGTNENLVINAKGSGTITLNPTGTGNVVFSRAATGVSLAVTAGLTSSGATGAGIGYATGAGGAVTQITTITTGVTLNTLTGTITTVSSTLAAGVDASFTLTNSTIAAGDTVVINTKSYGGTADGIPICKIQSTAAGSCIINIHNQGAVTLDALIVMNFAVIKAVAA